MKTLLAVLVLFCLVSCAAGPVIVAKNESEGIRSTYDDAKLNELSRERSATLRDIYQRYQLAKVDVYPAGIGFTTLSDNLGKKHYYLQVQVRPRNVSFGEQTSTPQTRLQAILDKDFEKNLKLLKRQDLEGGAIEGLAFGVSWPVRDLTQCDTYGGYVEYAMVYLTKAEFTDIAEGRTGFNQALRHAQVVTSLGLQKARTLDPSKAQ
jgi:hypothetical protein